MKGASADKVRSLVEEYLKAAAVYGREMELHATYEVGRELLASEKDPAWNWSSHARPNNS